MPLPAASSVTDYIASFPPEVQQKLELMRQTIREEAPGAEEGIGYGIPTFKLHGNLVHYAAFKAHIGFYPGPTGIRAFSGELKGYKQAKGSVQFPLSEELPLLLIRNMVRYRVGENEANAVAKKTPKT